MTGMTEFFYYVSRTHNEPRFAHWGVIEASTVEEAFIKIRQQHDIRALVLENVTITPNSPPSEGPMGRELC